MPRDPRPPAPVTTVIHGDFKLDKAIQTRVSFAKLDLAFWGVWPGKARFSGRPRVLSPLRRAAMKANRPLGGITYTDTRPPACETCAHPRDRDSGGIVGAVASVTSLSGQRRAKILSESVAGIEDSGDSGRQPRAAQRHFRSDTSDLQIRIAQLRRPCRAFGRRRGQWRNR